MVRMRVLAMGLAGIGGIAAAIGLAGCSGSSGPAPAAGPAMTVDMRAADEEAIRAADLGWSKAAGAKDAAGAASYYAEDGVLMAPMTPVTKGRTAIQQAFATMMRDPNFALSFSPTRVVVAKSGDIAYDYGNFQLTVSEKKGKANTLKAMYVVVWGKQGDGSWKALIDAPTTSSE
ncbi:MAG: SgcJ/EcaC family oxidoreductase [Candidatus Acidiferrum sp.]